MSPDTLEAAGEQSRGFNVNILFTGLAVFAPMASGELLVLQPDAHFSNNRDNGRGMKHLDGTDATAHAGYLSCDVRHFVGGDSEGEVVVRFNREAVEFGGLPPGRVGNASTIDLPDFSAFAPVLQLDPSLQGPAPCTKLLARIRLTGGTVAGEGDGMWRTVTRALTSPTCHGHQQTSKTFAHGVMYSGRSTSTHLTVQLTSFETGTKRTFSLAPVDGQINLKIANLCAENPLEWPELMDERETPSADLDFKWLTTLFVTRDGQEDPHYSAQHQVPYLIRTDDKRQGMISNCYPARGSFD